MWLRNVSSAGARVIQLSSLAKRQTGFPGSAGVSPAPDAGETPALPGTHHATIENCMTLHRSQVGLRLADHRESPIHKDAFQGAVGFGRQGNGRLPKATALLPFPQSCLLIIRVLYGIIILWNALYE